MPSQRRLEAEAIGGSRGDRATGAPCYRECARACCQSKANFSPVRRNSTSRITSGELSDHRKGLRGGLGVFLRGMLDWGGERASPADYAMVPFQLTEPWGMIGPRPSATEQVSGSALSILEFADHLRDRVDQAWIG